MTENKMNSSRDVHAYYADRMLDIARNINFTPIVWQDVWDEKVEVRDFDYNDKKKCDKK